MAVDDGSSTSDVIVRTTRKLLHPQALERCMFMAHNELQVVGELNTEEIRKFSDRSLITPYKLKPTIMDSYRIKNIYHLLAILG